MRVEPTREAYSFVCLHCGHGWEGSYDLRHATDANGVPRTDYYVPGRAGALSADPEHLPDLPQHHDPRPAPRPRRGGPPRPRLTGRRGGEKPHRRGACGARPAHPDDVPFPVLSAPLRSFPS